MVGRNERKETGRRGRKETSRIWNESELIMSPSTAVKGTEVKDNVYCLILKWNEMRDSSNGRWLMWKEVN